MFFKKLYLTKKIYTGESEEEFIKYLKDNKIKCRLKSKTIINYEMYNPNNPKEIITLIITGISSVSLLVNYILMFIAKKNKPKTIKIISKNGSSLEFSSDTSKEKLKEYQKILKEMNINDTNIIVENNLWN